MFYIFIPILYVIVRALYDEVSGCAEEDAMHLLIYLYIVYFYI